MVGWHLLLLLVVEVAAYGAIGRYAHVVRGWNTAASVALAVGIYLMVRILLVGAEFVLARWKGGPIPDRLQVSPGQLFTIYLRELAGWLLMFSLTLPFVLSRRSVIDRSDIPRSPAPPIILIHGLACNRGTWFWFRRQLEDRGHCAFTIDCTPWFARIDSYPEQLAKAIDEVLGATGAGKVVLIGHSMGGLIARAYIDRMGADKIERTITLGTPHQGTWMTRFGFTPNVQDMAEDSAWLTGLRAREGQRSSNPYANFTCLFTHHDNLVTPHLNATLPGAAEIAVSGIGHLSLTLSPLIIERVLAVLAGTKRTD